MNINPDLQGPLSDWTKLKIMIVNHNNFPEAMELLLRKTDKLEQLIVESEKRSSSKEVNEKMDTVSLTEFMTSQGLRMSKSKLYKLVSAGKIPYMKFNGCLVFSRTEITEWINCNMFSPEKVRSEAVAIITRTAINQTRRISDGN